MRKRTLNITADRDFLRRLLAAGHAFDLERGSLYDARSGVINVWCSPDDKPPCWDVKITPGGLSHPRAYVGALGWDWRDEEQAELYVEATPFALLGRKPRRPLAEQEWEEVLAWLREKALGLVRLAQLEPRLVGTRCPFCPFVLPAGQLLNGLVEHIAGAHPEVRLQEIVLGSPPVLRTDRGQFLLESVEKFE
jgi:hypothetical protein